MHADDTDYAFAKNHVNFMDTIGTWLKKLTYNSYASNGMRRKSLTFTNHTESQDRRHIFSSTKIKRRKPTSIRHETIACIIADRFFKLIFLYKFQLEYDKSKLVFQSTTLPLIKSYRTKQSHSNIDRVGFVKLVIIILFLSLIDALLRLPLESCVCIGGHREADRLCYM